ncbi:MAG: methyltransferase domain-containing protein [Chitinivibrionales bacterium]|nr:methyltransferase domain-containing protein [Chitinivibrionales bacterium]MBD3356855.1 methyltransferase domain-containing protein [Chitinivibrionales bacterium]
MPRLGHDKSEENVAERKWHLISMDTNTVNPISSTAPYDYLRIERYLTTFVDAQALKLGLANGLIEYIVADPGAELETIARVTGTDVEGSLLLLRLLAANGVVARSHNRFSLTPHFAASLPYRELIELKIEYADMVMADLKEHFGLYVGRFDLFMRDSRTFDLFTYQRCYTMSEENYAITSSWMRFTTAVTKFEALVCMERHDFSGYKTLLDIGGNSGEFALQLCKRQPHMYANVFDLPVVCAVGEKHVQDHPEADRIRFISGDALVDPIPGTFDAVSFKSFLHDWPEEAVADYIARAYELLTDNGTCIIFERGPLDLEKGTPSYAMIPVMLFHRNFRTPDFYLATLKKVGFRHTSLQEFDLETPFYIIIGQK